MIRRLTSDRAPAGSALLACVLLLLPVPLGAQSLFGARGLGLPLRPLDARSMALGGVGVGLPGPGLVPFDVASSAWLGFPTVAMTAQPQWTKARMEGASSATQATRFPHVGIAFPWATLRGVVSLTIGGFLDQRWEVREETTVDLGGVQVPATDAFESDGGVSTVLLGWGQRLGDRLALGVGVGSRMGLVTRTFTRTVDSTAVGFQIVPYRVSGDWQYRGLMATVGARWDPSDLFHIAGAVDWPAKLKARPVRGTEGETVTYDLPMEARVGASAVLTPRLAVTLGLAYAAWDASGEGLDPDLVTGPTWSFGGGLEWTGAQLGVRSLPLRAGFRRSGLPFTFDGKAATEQAAAIGFGLNLTRPQDFVVGGVDVAFERGSRDAGRLSESFWRGTFTVRISSW